MHISHNRSPYTLIRTQNRNEPYPATLLKRPYCLKLGFLPSMPSPSWDGDRWILLEPDNCSHLPPMAHRRCHWRHQNDPVSWVRTCMRAVGSFYKHLSVPADTNCPSLIKDWQVTTITRTTEESGKSGVTMLGGHNKQFWLPKIWLPRWLSSAGRVPLSSGGTVACHCFYYHFRVSIAPPPSLYK